MSAWVRGQTIRNLIEYYEMNTCTKRTFSVAFLIATILSSIPVTIAGAQTGVEEKMDAGEPFTQDLVLTAYYSPLPDQCCYVKGGFREDVILNGQGTNGADGTEVYPGMVAAPPSYPFGTRIEIPGLGTFTVHDRGGAIQEQGVTHRLDVWAGAGEEGLARALAFGVKRMHATVYPPSSQKPQESFSLASLPAPVERLRPYVVAHREMFPSLPGAGESGLSVKMLQQGLVDAGYLQESPNGFFGSATQVALASFYADFAVMNGGDRLTESGAVLLQAFLERKHAKSPVAAVIDKTSPPAAIVQAKRTLRFLDFYDGRTNGNFDDRFIAAILKFQQSQGLITDAASPGAGRIGPKTRTAIITLWNRKLVTERAQTLLLVRRVDRLLAARDDLIGQFLGKGDKGADVRRLQAILAARGLLKGDQITGLFGAATEQAVTLFQMAKGIITANSDQGAGYVGPATLRSLWNAERERMIRVVREKGWQAI